MGSLQELPPNPPSSTSTATPSLMQAQQTTTLPANEGGGVNPLANNESAVALMTVVRTVGYTAAGILKTLNPVAGINSTKALTMNAKREIFKLLDVRAYARPSSSDEAMRRIRANLAFFKLTYAAIPMAFVIYFVLSNPTLFISILACAGLWGAFFALGPDRTWQIGSVSLGRGEKLTALGLLTTIIIVFGGLITYALYVVFGSGMVVVAHTVVREPVAVDPLEELEREGQSIVSGDVV